MQLDQGTTSSKNFGIELLRVMLVLYIVGFWHLLNYTDAIRGYNNIFTSTLTDIVLATFTFISGFFAANKFQEINKKGTVEFFKKKVLRIYPLYLLAIAAFVLLGLSSTTIAAKAIFSLSMLLKPAPQTLWFITMLMLFLLLTPLFVFLAQRLNLKNYWRIVILGVLGGSIWYYLFRTIDLRLLLYFPAYMTSILLAQNKLPLAPKHPGILIIAFGTLLLSLPELASGGLTILLNLPLVTISSYLLFSHFYRVKFTAIKLLPLLTFISYASYSLYLFHRPLLVMMKSIYFPENLMSQLFLLVFIYFPFTVIFAFDIQKLYDMSLNFFFRTHARNKETVPMVPSNA